MGAIHPKLDVTAQVKRQVERSSCPLYNLVSLAGDGILVDLMKEATSTKDYQKLDQAIKEMVTPYLYNGGDGKHILKSELVNRRRNERKDIYEILAEYKPGENEQDELLMQDYFRRPRGIISRLDQNDRDVLPDASMIAQSASKNIEGMRRHQSAFFKGDLDDKNVYDDDVSRFCCWDIDKRGTVGETILHLCILNGSSLLTNLAKRLLKHFPNLACDIYIGDEYYGENCLHMAIVNEIPHMLKLLLSCNVSLHDRACGNFFCADDQKESRNDYSDHEWIRVPLKTNYKGLVYLGEYPLSFAACLGLSDCVRLLVAHGVDINRRDSNGNTALHMAVIFNRMEIFDLLHELGANLEVKNRQQMTSLSLAAHMANYSMYKHITDLRMHICWSFGQVSCGAYPLQNLDTIAQNGEIDDTSVLYKIVHGSESSHLKMYDQMIIDLLDMKWKTSLRVRFIIQFILFFTFMVIFCIAFYLRPLQDQHPQIFTVESTLPNGTKAILNKTEPRCYLFIPVDNADYARLVLEALTLIFAVFFVIFTLYRTCTQSRKIFFETMSFAPTLAMFMTGCFLIVLSVIGRLACYPPYEDVIIVLAMLCCSSHFLFYCRGIKVFGPFVVMIYKIIARDMVRFFLIYLIFLVGFSQSLYVCFRTVAQKNSFDNPFKALLSMFAISLHEFQELYAEFELSQHHLAAKVVFLFNMVFTSILLTNLLIAMMVDTYRKIVGLEREWLRQWSQIILVMELSISKETRLKYQKRYSETRISSQERYYIYRAIVMDDDS